MSEMTPREIVHELDKHIIGQSAAKRAVAIALRNRWRRMQIEPELREEMINKANGGHTVPQIFIKEQHIGGCDDMMALEAQGKLDALLK